MGLPRLALQRVLNCVESLYRSAMARNDKTVRGYQGKEAGATRSGAARLSPQCAPFSKRLLSMTYATVRSYDVRRRSNRRMGQR